MLSPLKSSRRARKFLVYDMEWVPGLLDVRMVGVFDGDHYRWYSTVEQFLAHELTVENAGQWFFAHAGGLADVQFVLDTIISRGGYRCKAAFSGAMAINVSVSRDKRHWHFVDSYRLLQDKLKNIGKWIGMAKGSDSFRGSCPDPDEEGISDEEHDRRQKLLREWYATVDIKELVTYNLRDCEILWHAIDQFETVVMEYGGELKKTFASTAMNMFRRQFLSLTIDTHPMVNDISRLSYVASRVEVFQEEIDTANYFDINSSFPAAMLTPCPGRFLGSRRQIRDGELYVADCTVTVAEDFVPPLPYRYSGRIFFPTGRWRQWLTSVDVELLLSSNGRIEKVHDVLEFEPFYDLYNFADTFYKLRMKTDDPVQRVVFKLFLNALYGKFAESPYKQSMMVDPPVITKTMTMLMPGVWLEEKKVPIPHMHVPISAHITAVARKAIFDYISKCEDVHYCDTDGFSTTSDLATGGKLGELKLEKRVRHGRFVAPKVYSIQGEELQKDGSWRPTSWHKAKGFSRMTATRFARVLEGETIEFERMRRIKENLRSGSSKPREDTILKKLQVRNLWDPTFIAGKHLLPKRMHYPDGHTRPWTIDEIHAAHNGGR